MIVLLALLSVTFAQTWQSTIVYSGTSCSGNAALVVANSQPTCIAASCSQSGGLANERVCLSSTAPTPSSLGSKLLIAATYNGGGCSGTPTLITGVQNTNQCVSYVGKSYRASCTSTSFSWEQWNTATNCVGNSDFNITGTFTSANTCSNSGSGSTLFQCAASALSSILAIALVAVLSLLAL